MASDSEFLFAIVLILVVSSLVSASLQATFNSSSSSNNLDSVAQQSEDLTQVADSTTAITALKVLGSILIWSFGLLPTWLDTIFILLRIMGWYLLARVIRGV